MAYSAKMCVTNDAVFRLRSLGFSYLVHVLIQETHIEEMLPNILVLLRVNTAPGRTRTCDFLLAGHANKSAEKPEKPFIYSILQHLPAFANRLILSHSIVFYGGITTLMW